MTVNRSVYDGTYSFVTRFLAQLSWYTQLYHHISRKKVDDILKDSERFTALKALCSVSSKKGCIQLCLCIACSHEVEVRQHFEAFPFVELKLTWLQVACEDFHELLYSISWKQTLLRDSFLHLWMKKAKVICDFHCFASSKAFSWQLATGEGRWGILS